MTTKKREVVTVDGSKQFGIKDMGEIPGLMNMETHPEMKSVDTNYVWQKPLLRVLICAWRLSLGQRLDKGVYLFGPTGSGKTSGPIQFFTRLGVPVYTVAANASTELQDLLCQQRLMDGDSIDFPGPLAKAMEDGVPFLLNEFDVMHPDETIGLNDVIERGETYVPGLKRTIKAKPGFIFIAACNSNGSGDHTGSYHGVQEQNISLLHRFIQLPLDYLPRAQEKKLVDARAKEIDPQGIAGEIIDKMLDVAQKIRSAFQGGQLRDVMGIRDTAAWAQYALVYGSVKEKDDTPISFALKTTFINGLTEHDQTVARNIAQEVFGSLFP